jgi:D-alanyl-D-alanine carboxypeptidase/D-alanyl-D-alanine-endopeptidase (penicillin-binding protein 4)
VAALGAVALALVVAVLAAAAAIGGYAATSAARATDRPSRSPVPTPSALHAATVPPPSGSTSPAAPGPVAAKVATRLAAALGSAALGPRLRARIVDLTAGTVLYDHGGNVPVAPASTAKLLAAAALFAVRRPTDRLLTTARVGPGGALVLVGGGDPTITGAAAGRPAHYAGAARLSDLAAQVRAADIRPTKIVVDDSLFTGPTVSPSWAAEDVPSDYGAAITATLTDGGRAAPDDRVRSAAPDLAAGHELAAALGRPGLSVERGHPATAKVVGTVRSAPLSTLVHEMMLYSDNVIAECLARQVALAEKMPPTFTGSAAAIRAVLRRSIKLDVGAGLVDASGLAARDRVSPATLLAVLTSAARVPRLRDVLTALPVGAWSGTLVDRYVGTSTRSAAGLVRAKTGTLTGVSALAGLVHDRSGAVLAFALVADRAPDTAGAEAALDVVVDRLAGCGC